MKGFGAQVDGSDKEVLSRLFDKAFAQYWMIQWCHQGPEHFCTFPEELNSAMMLWRDRMPALVEAHVQAASGTVGGGSSSSKLMGRGEQNSMAFPLEQLELAFQLCMIGCSELDVISRNDEIADIHTDNLKYLMLPYLAAHVTMQKPGLSDRAVRIRRSMVYVTEFLHTLARLGILGQRESVYWDRCLGDIPTERRDFRVASTKQSIEILGSLRSVFNCPENIERFFAQANSMSNDEEAARAHLLKLLQLFSSEAINLYDMVKIEMPMLSRYDHESRAGARDKREPPSQGKPSGKPWLIHVDGKSKLDPTTAHFLYKQLIFVPGHRLPEISLDECARIEMEMDVKTIGAKKDEGARIASREGYSADSEGSESDYTSDSRDDAEVAKEKAKWDDWKDDHPSGSGNKNRNVG
ncbi:uncharacterized protein BXIN_1877 [Babesia sp. Xinjiang]|uniref:uncharacterized protein n=1 Tax=Babesia sp. Xinjiang TaxID=462227 RepID=UPI000A25041C|nr:uncharacterized protein BXIN_1877 [Babesia sp. Xinjiang]ORM40372.1 hypothetical protein BXIN_1877 [Babesia sp. Xinjiang]